MGPPWHPCLPGSKGDYRCSGQPRKSWATETLTKILTLLPGNHQQQHNLCSFDYLLQWVYSDRLCTSILLISLWHESCAESCKRARGCLALGKGKAVPQQALRRSYVSESSPFFCPKSSSAQNSSAIGNTVGQNEASVTLIKHQKHLRLVRSWQLAVMGGSRASVLGEQNSLMDEVITARSANQRKVKSSKVLEGSCSQVATESQNISLTR